jgi:hypothetical protein
MEPCIRLVADATLGRPEMILRVGAIIGIAQASLLIQGGLTVAINATERNFILTRITVTNVPNA